jgi:hypothetical protein
MDGDNLQDDENSTTIDFVSLVNLLRIQCLISQGMFIIDDIYDSEGTQLGTDLPGGAGIGSLLSTLLGSYR